MKTRTDLSGMRFGKWTVIELSEIRNRASYWLCECDCGRRKSVIGTTLNNGASASCGCATVAAVRSRLTKHGMADSKLHMIWVTMRARCRNPNNKSYRNYGGRGIAVCDRWQDFANFLQDMGPTWSDGLSVERLDVNGDYEPSNCVWIPRADQSKNRRPSSEWTFKNAHSTR